MSQKIKAIIFDFGNVLLEWDPRHVYRRYFETEEAMEQFLHEINFMDWNLQQDKGRPFNEGVAELSKQFPQYAELIQAYYDNWIHSVGDSLTGTIEILRRLKEAGFSIYGLSNWSAETFPLARQKYDFFNLLDDFVISGHVGYVKPDPEIFKILLTKIGYSASECLFIDDSLANIKQAQRMGFVTIHFKTPEQLDQELHELGLP